MKNLDFRRYALSSCVAAAMLAGCGGQTSSGVVTVSGAPNSVSGHHTFNFTGTAQIFRVPYGVTQIRVIALGGNGGGSSDLGYGGRVSAVIPVKQLENLSVFVGGDASGPGGGFNGGGNGGDKFSSDGNGGGGAFRRARRRSQTVRPRFGCWWRGRRRRRRRLRL